MVCTDWDVTFSPGDNLGHTMTVIFYYFAFCEDTIIPNKPTQSFLNSTPWIMN